MIKRAATHDQMMRAIEEYLQSEDSLDKIAKKHGCTHSGLRNKMRNLGITKDPMPTKASRICDEKAQKALELVMTEKYSLTECCRRCSIHITSFKKWVVENNKKHLLPKKRPQTWKQIMSKRFLPLG